MKILIHLSLTLAFVLLLLSYLNAQPPIPAEPPQAPIDGGLGLLAAAGGAYAYKKLRDRKKDEEVMDDKVDM